MDSIANFLASLLGGASGAGPGIGQSLMAIGVAYLGGILSSLTPCVYPMIPITVGVIGSGGEGRLHWKDVLLRALSYLVGMTVIYAFLGVLAGLTGKVFGSFTNSSGWYLSLGIIISLASLMMMEVIPFDPLAWYNKLRGHRPTQFERKEMTLLGAFALGASSGLIAAPCTTPALTAILAYIAKTQSIGLGMALMIAFSLGLGTLLLVIAMFTGALRVLPRSGMWMKRIKVAGGLVLLAFGEYLIYLAGKAGGP